MLNINDKSELIREHNSRIWSPVDGWVGDRVFTVLQWIYDHQTARNITGDIVEIGVHHGKFLLGMGPLLSADERLVAIDIWEDQHLNVDHSGNGSKEVFLGHANTFLPDADVRLISGDSMMLSSDEIRREMSRPKCKIFSVDGGHTPAHVINDLKLAQDVIAPGGIIALDDFMGPAWPTVTEGLYDYLSYHNTRLAPFLIFQNKLWLTTFSEQSDALASVADHFEQRAGSEWFSRWRYTMIKNWKVLSFA